MRQKSATDEPHSGWPIEFPLTALETTENIHKSILAGQRVKVSELAETVDISTEALVYDKAVH